MILTQALLTPAPAPSTHITLPDPSESGEGAVGSSSSILQMRQVRPVEQRWDKNLPRGAGAEAFRQWSWLFPRAHCLSLSFLVPSFHLVCPQSCLALVTSGERRRSPGSCWSRAGAQGASLHVDSFPLQQTHTLSRTSPGEPRARNLPPATSGL